jgi:oligosaccharide repeat unit polymerase
MFSVTQRSGIEGRDLSWSPRPANRGYIFGWITASAFLLGLLTFWSHQPLLLPVFFTAGYIALLFAMVRTAHVWRDPLNPLCLILFIGFVRFSCPGFLHWSGAEPPKEVGDFFALMGLSDSNWQWGHALALAGLLAAVAGWFFTQPRRVRSERLKFYLPDGVKYSAAVGMLIGAMALATFFFSNASLSTIFSGAFRATAIQKGTGKYFHLSYLLMAGSVLLCCYLLTRGKRWVSFYPVGFSMLLYWVLGGRGRATTAFAGGLLILWYLIRERNGWRRVSVKSAQILFTLVGLLVAVWLLYVGELYRGQIGSRAFSESLSLTGLWEYIESSIYTDMGQLHSLAGAIAIGPGVLGGQTFIGSLAWPLDKFLPIPGRSAGVFIVDRLIGFGNEGKWGVNASLIGDAYLNFGITGVFIVMSLFGALLKFLYLQFRQGKLHGAIYALALLSALQAFWLSIEVWPQALVTLTFALLLIFLGKTLFRMRLERGLTR